MASILVLIPVKQNIPAALAQRARHLLSELLAAEQLSGAHTIEAHIETRLELGDGLPYSAHAAARNAMLDSYLRDDHTHVLWIDADLTSYPRDLASQLYAIDPENIVAPFVLIEQTRQFYDTRGFIDIVWQHATPSSPYLQGDSIVPMQSVGCCYLAPARAFRPSRYLPIAGHTEHYSICATFDGMVWAARSVLVYHAALPRYGEDWHVWPTTSTA